MIGKSTKQSQSTFLYSTLKEMLNPKNELYFLAENVPWDIFEEEFKPLYSEGIGRPAKRIRLMVALHLLKHLYNRGDETVCEQWVQNPYWQFFSGEEFFQWQPPCEPSDMVYFRKRIGEKGVEKILAVSIGLHGKDALEPEVTVDTTVQEKNITFPTDSKLHRKIINRCQAIAKKENITLRQSYRRIVKQLMIEQRGGRSKKQMQRSRKARKRMKTIAGILVRELERKLPASVRPLYDDFLLLSRRILAQQRGTKNKVYSLHEPDVYCLAKGKEHKKYEFGSKASITVTKQSGIIVGAMDVGNRYDGKTLPRVLSQVERLRGCRPLAAIADRGYRGRRVIDGTEILIPGRPSKQSTQHERRKARKRFRRRAAIEPLIGHLKSDYRLNRNYLKGTVGDSINLMLAAAACNLKKLMRKLRLLFSFLSKSGQWFLKDFLNCIKKTNGWSVYLFDAR